MTKVMGNKSILKDPSAPSIPKPPPTTAFRVFSSIMTSMGYLHPSDVQFSSKLLSVSTTPKYKITNDLWGTENERNNSKKTAVAEIRNHAKLRRISNKLALKELYQPKSQDKAGE